MRLGRVVAIVGADQWKAHLAGELSDAGWLCGRSREGDVLDSTEQVLGPQNVASTIVTSLAFAISSFKMATATSPEQVTGERDQPVVVLLQQGMVDTRLVVIALEMRL